jgi:AraC family transcriptional activator of pobA
MGFFRTIINIVPFYNCGIKQQIVYFCLYNFVVNKNKEHVPLHSIKTKEMDPSGFDVIELGRKGGYDSSVPHRHAFFEFIFFLNGGGTHEVDFNKYPIEKNSVHFVSPGQIHKMTLKNTKGYVICFTEDFISVKLKDRFVETFPFFDSSNFPVLRLNKGLSAEIDFLINAIKRELMVESHDGIDIYRSYLNIILLKIKSFFSSGIKNTGQTNQNKRKKVTLFKKLINENYLSHKTVSDYAGELNVTPNHLNALCKGSEGKTATQLIHQRLVLESKRLLYATDMHIKEISFSLHFEDVPYFNRFFKKQTGLTPIEYRKQFYHKSLKSASH